MSKIFEIDPVICRCGAHMKIVSIIIDPRIVGRIPRHRQSERCMGRYTFGGRINPWTSSADYYDYRATKPAPGLSDR